MAIKKTRRGKTRAELFKRDVRENVREVSLIDTATNNLKIYGSYTLEQRAIPDYRDGLKPVHRMSLWAMKELPAHYNDRYQKAAKIVGLVIGNFHPHGDCLRGDTKVPLLNGTVVKIKDLIGSGKKWVLSYDKKVNKLVPALAHSWRVGQTAKKYYRLTLSTGEIIECTKNHQFLTKEKGWIRADELELYNELIGGVITNHRYPHLRTNVGQNEYLHSLVGDSKFSKDDSEVYHHKNQDTKDNRPSNLEVQDREGHAELHEDYLVGLENGRTEMFCSDGIFRAAIKKKNSKLMSEYNKQLPLIKALRAIDLLRERKMILSETNYERLRPEIYNLTRLSTVYEKGHTWESLVGLAIKGFKLDTSDACGLTKKIHKQRRKDNLKIIREPNLPSQYDSHNCKFAMAKVIQNCIDKNSSWNKVSWDTYSVVAAAQAKHNLDKVIYTDTDAIKKYYGIKSISGLAKTLDASFLNLIVKIETVECEPEEFYDFTVDKYENMIVYTSKGEKTGNFVVAHNSGVYDSMVTMANLPEKLIDGRGNWGTPTDGAGAYRYTECRLSQYAEENLLDKDYLAVCDYVDNFSGDRKIPIILPAKLPNLLINGSEGIATGASGLIPSFSKQSVVKLVKRALRGKIISAKTCLKYLEFKFTYGGTCISPDEDILNYFKTGSGSLLFQPSFKLLPDKILITSLAPRFITSKSLESRMEKYAKLPNVILVQDESDKEGWKIAIYFNKKLDDKQIRELNAQIEKESTTKLPLQTSITERNTDETVTFRYSNIPTIFNDWIKWRIQLELKVIHYLISVKDRELEKLSLLQLAAQNLPIMKQTMDVPDPHKLLKKLKLNGVPLTDTQADFLLDLKFRQLTKLSRSKLLEDIKKVKINITTLKTDLKDPNTRILKTLGA